MVAQAVAVPQQQQVLAPKALSFKARFFGERMCAR
jgi:hypothetical protein